jgi:hypothetical protein
MGSGSKSTNKIIAHQNEQIEKQFDMDLKNYEFLWGQRVVRDDEGNPILDENGDYQFDQMKDEDGTLSGTQNNEYDYAVESLNKKRAADQKANDYQNETALQNWEFGKSQQKYAWDKEDEIYRKNQTEVDTQKEFNNREYTDSLAREQMVLDETFIKAAFDNENLLSELYESVGLAGFEKTRAEFNLSEKEQALDYAKNKQLINLDQQTASAGFAQSGEELKVLSRRGGAEYEQANIAQGLAEKEANARFQKAALSLDTKTRSELTEFQNAAIMRKQRQQNLTSAHQTQELTLKALKASGQAQLTQAGRSRGKQLQSILADVGRQQTYLSESLVFGQQEAEARMKQNQASNLRNVQQAAIREQQIDTSSIQAIQRAMMGIEESDRKMKIGDAESGLNMDKIKRAVYDNITNAEIDITKIESDLTNAQAQTGLDLSKIDWEQELVGSRFATNQDILTASLESAIKASEMNEADLLREKEYADFVAEANRMLDPSIGRDAIDLADYKPETIPLPDYQDPLAPPVPPAPIKGATQQAVGISDTLPGAALSGAIAGVTTGMAAANLGWAAGPIGVGVGLATTFLNL